MKLNHEYLKTLETVKLGSDESFRSRKKASKPVRIFLINGLTRSGIIKKSLDEFENLKCQLGRARWGGEGGILRLMCSPLYDS